MHVTKIKSIRPMGIVQTYNLRMASEQHNYLVTPNSGEPIHKNSHSCAYVLVAYWCAWLKAHFPPEWWAAVMSGCHADRIPRYMNTARLEGVKFGVMHADNLTESFSVAANLEVTPGLTSIKGIGNKVAVKLEGRHQFSSIDEFVTQNGKDKRIMEPLIKLGAFERYHQNLKATWMWYQYRYCTGKLITALKKEINSKLLIRWTPEKIEEQRQRYIKNFKAENPKRKVPDKYLNWMPKIEKDNETLREQTIALYDEDFSLKERLDFEKQYLGYYWHSPLDLFETVGGLTIQVVKDSLGNRGKIECVVETLTVSKTKTQKKMGRLKVTDGLSDCTIILWANQLEVLSPYLKAGTGVRIDVQYDPSRNSFTLGRYDAVPILLRYKSELEQSNEESN